MKRFFIGYALILSVFSMCLVSCGKNEIQYYPFISEEDKNFGLISVEGEVLYENEFEKEPTVVVNDRFWVRNDDGLWELYSSEDDKPKRIGNGEYVQVGLFYEGVAPVVAKGQPIQFIDKEGNVKVTLKEIDGKMVEGCWNFWDGTAVVRLEGNVYGTVDIKGNTKIKPIYGDITCFGKGRYGAIVKAEGKEIPHNWEGQEFVVFNESGEHVSKIKLKKNQFVVKKWHCEGRIAIGEEVDGNTRIGWMDENGEWILRPQKDIGYVWKVTEDYFVYSKTFSDNYGVMNWQGDNILRPKYKDILYGGIKNRFFVKEVGEKEFKLIDETGKELKSDSYLHVGSFIGKYAPVEISDGECIFIDKNGKEKKIKTRVYGLDQFATGDGYIESQYVDLDSFVNKLKITQFGFLDINMEMTPDKAIASLKKNKVEYVDTQASDYKYKSSIEGNIEINRISVAAEINYSTLTIPIKRKEKEYIPYLGYYTYEKTMGYRFSKEKPEYICAMIESTGLMDGKIPDLIQKLKYVMKSYGNVLAENKSGLCVKTKSGNTFFVVYGNRKVYLVLSSHTLTQEEAKKTITQFESTQDGGSSKQDYSYEDELADSVAVEY